MTVAYKHVHTLQSTEVIEPFRLCYVTGSWCRHATQADPRASGISSSRRFNSNVSTPIQLLEQGGIYEVALSGSCVMDDELFLDAAGRVSPTGPGPLVGRAQAAGSAGSTTQFIYEPITSGGGGGLTPDQINNMIDARVVSQESIDSTPDNRQVVDSDWRNGTPNEFDLIRLTKLPSTRNRQEVWQRGAAPDVWTQVAVILTDNTQLMARKDGSDSLGNNAGAFTINFDGGDYDNKRLTLTGDATIDLTATRGGAYMLLINNSGGHTINWAAQLAGSTPVVIGEDTVILVYNPDNGNFDTFTATTS